MERSHLTRREKDIYDFLLRYRADNSCSPSMREIAEGVDLYSVSTVHKHIHSMAEKGWIRIPEGRSRSIIPV